jgi:hypothetical protein
LPITAATARVPRASSGILVYEDGARHLGCVTAAGSCEQANGNTCARHHLSGVSVYASTFFSQPRAKNEIITLKNPATSA